MSASLCGNMRGSQVKTSLLLLLLLLTSSTGTEDSNATETTPETNGPDLTSTFQPSSTESESSGQAASVPEPGEETEGVSGVYGEDPPENETSTDSADEEDDGSFTITLIIVVVAVVILGMIVGVISFFCQRNKRAINQELSKEDPYLDGSSTEKVPMPMFEEDVPSVQELEMEELDQWMKKDNSPNAS